MFFVRSLLLYCSIFGYMLFFTKQCRVDATLSPAISVSFLLLAVFICGLLGVLAWSVYLLLALGIALMVWMLLKKTPTDWKDILTNPALIFLSLSVVYLLIRFQNRVLYSYDDFSHWGLMAKTILQLDRLPNAANSFIIFQSYPPGSACWIYFVVRALGSQEGVYLFAQSILTLTYLSTILVLFKNHRWYDQLLAIIGIVLIATNVVSPSTLSVDVLLGASGLAAVAVVFYYRSSLTKMWLYLLPMICIPLLIKNSGVFFALIPIALSFYFLRKQNATPASNKWLAAALITIVPIIILLLWRQHVAVSFPEGLASKHAISFQSYRYRWQSNDNHAIEMIRKTASWMINPLKDNALIVFGGFGLLFALDAILNRNQYTNKQNLHLFVAIMLLIAVYEFGTAIMYLFSMSYSEFTYQNGRDYIRYNNTLVDFLLGLLLMWVGKQHALITVKPDTRTKLFAWMLRGFTLLLLLGCTLPGTKLPMLSLTYSTESESRIEQLHKVLDAETLPPESKYFVKTSQKDADYARYVFRYLLSSADVTVSADPVSPSKIQDIIASHAAYIEWEKDSTTIYTADSLDH